MSKFEHALHPVDDFNLQQLHLGLHKLLKSLNIGNTILSFFVFFNDLDKFCLLASIGCLMITIHIQHSNQPFLQQSDAQVTSF